MSNQKPYGEYEPNEPPYTDTGTRKTLSPARPISSASAVQAPLTAAPAADTRYAACQPSGWDAGQYIPNEAPAETSRQETGAGTARRRTARSANPYTQATWDEEPYLYRDAEQQIDSAATEKNPSETALRAAAQRAKAAVHEKTGETPAVEPIANTAAARPRANPYARPAVDTDGVSDLSARFAPPLKFELPQAARPAVQETYPEPEPAQPNLYRTRGVTHTAADMQLGATPRSDGYRVEAEDGYGRGNRRRRHPFRKLLVTLLILGVLGAAAYLERDWLLAQARKLLGQSTVQATLQDVASDTQQGKGYDPAPALQVGQQAQEGINAVAGDVGLETYAVTDANVIARVKTADSLYDIYLFASADGLLLGYYEDVPENGFLVCPDNVYYVNQPPYLLNSRGEPLVDQKKIRGAAGEGAVLGPMLNGWATIMNAQGTSGNLIDADGNLFSQLWFCKVFPFTGEQTLAYVDTGNTTDPDERYTLYELTRTGEMKLWKHSADTSEVLGCAAGIALMNTGDLIRLGGDHTPLCTANDVAVYADCGAVVARDIQTGKYGLFVNGEQRYDFAYDSIAPVVSDIQWATEQVGFYQLHNVTGRAYPLPLAYYFSLNKGETQEMVALSAGSAYPLLLNDD